MADRARSLHKKYIHIQSAFIREWVTAVAVGIAKGWSKEECVKRISFLDRFPVDIGQEYMGPRVQELNVMALYDYLTRDRQGRLGEHRLYAPIAVGLV